MKIIEPFRTKEDINIKCQLTDGLDKVITVGQNKYGLKTDCKTYVFFKYTEDYYRFRSSRYCQNDNILFYDIISNEDKNFTLYTVKSGSYQGRPIYSVGVLFGSIYFVMIDEDDDEIE